MTDLLTPVRNPETCTFDGVVDVLLPLCVLFDLLVEL